MTTFSDIHYQSWQAYHEAMLSSIPMSVLHPGYPPPLPDMGNRGMSVFGEFESSRYDDLDDYSEEADEYPIPTYPVIED